MYPCKSKIIKMKKKTYLASSPCVLELSGHLHSRGRSCYPLLSDNQEQAAYNFMAKRKTLDN